MTSLGDFLHFGQLFKVFTNNKFAHISHILRQFLQWCQNLSFWATFIDIWQFVSGHIYCWLQFASRSTTFLLWLINWPSLPCRQTWVSLVEVLAYHFLPLCRATILKFEDRQLLDRWGRKFCPRTWINQWIKKAQPSLKISSNKSSCQFVRVLTTTLCAKMIKDLDKF